MLVASMGMNAQMKTGLTDEYKNGVREKLQLDYSMSDYSTNKIVSRVIGVRLANILTKIDETYTQQTNLSALSVIQSSQVDGLNYGRVKKMKLKGITKLGNEIKVEYITVLEANNLNIKKALLTFRFVDGVSEDRTTNDYFLNVCRYLNE